MIVLKRQKSEKAKDGEFTISTDTECWTNFVYETFNQFCEPGNPPPNEVFRNELKSKYGGSMFRTHIEFETEVQLAFFILKFS